jgi:hypothetical protein
MVLVKKEGDSSLYGKAAEGIPPDGRNDNPFRR